MVGVWKGWMSGKGVCVWWERVWGVWVRGESVGRMCELVECVGVFV